MVNLKTILNDHQELLSLSFGSTEQMIESVCTPEKPRPHALCFFSQKNHLNDLQTNLSCAWFITQDLWDSKQNLLTDAARLHTPSIIICRNLQIAMAQILRYFDQREQLLSFPKGISPQSWIHPSARIASDVTVGPFTTIGPGVSIDEGSSIGPHCSIEGDVRIGSHCYLESHIFVGRQTQIGHHCRIKPFASIGTDGYGYAPTPTGPLKIPQIGIVVLEDYVDIGSGTCVDRATLTQTRIGKGSKLDNLVHIAHNCDIGQYCFLTAGFAMAGSSKIGDYFMTGGTSAVGDHVHITEKVTLAGASVVTGDIEKSGSYGGNPIQPMSEYLRMRVLLTQLPDMRRKLMKVLKHLNLGD